MNDRQKLFVAEYLVDLNATQAAVRAGYSEKSAGELGRRNMRHPAVKAEIETAMAVRAERTELTQDQVVGEIARLAFMDPAELRHTDKLKALELLGRHLGLFHERGRPGATVSSVSASNESALAALIEELQGRTVPVRAAPAETADD